MTRYKEERERQTKRAAVTGLVMTGAVHALVFAVGFSASLSYLYPPPQETSFLIDFSDAQKTDAGRRVRQVQPSASPYESLIANEAAAPDDDFGDVELPEQQTENTPEIDPRALFPGMASSPGTAAAPQAGARASPAHTQEQTQGKPDESRTSGTANVHLAGRTVVGSLPVPAYSIQKEGIVVVRIKVDQDGNVKEAVAGDEGTTVMDPTLLNAARQAALGAHFNPSADPIQIGTITYIFKLT